MMTDFLARLRADRRLFRPEDGAGAAQAAGAAEGVDAGGGAPAPKWFEDQRFTEAHRTAIAAKGLAEVEPMDALARVIDMQINADRKLGRPADELIPRPKKDQDVAAWMRENAGLFGIPEAPEKYEVKRPEGWPKDAKWDDALETQARKVAHEEGLPPRALQRLTDVYAGAVGRLMESAQAELETARTAMMADLERDWGGQAEARITRAQQAASVVGEKLGLDQNGILSLVQSIAPKTGDAGVMRLFDLIGDMMSSDTGIGIGKGEGSLGMTPAEAKQKIAEMRSPEGAYGKAYAAQNRTEMARLQPEIERLTRIAAGG
jgi:hypothetical protein